MSFGTHCYILRVALTGILLATLPLLLVRSVACAGVNQWTEYGLSGSKVHVLAIDPQVPTTFYAGTEEEGVFKSTDGGTNWIPVNVGLPSFNITALAIDPKTPTTVYVGTVDMRVFQSTNGGQTWTAKNNGLTNPVVRAIAIDPITPTTLYVGTSATIDMGGNLVNGGIFKSTDGSETWTAINSGLPSNPGDRISIRSLAVEPRTPTIVYAGVNVFNANSARSIPFSNIFKSADGGATWTVSGNLPFSPLNSVFSLAIDPETPTTIYASVLFYIGPGGILKSIDGGVSWTFSNNGFTTPFIGPLVIDPVIPTTLYAGTSAGVFKSTDSGTNWVPINEGLTNLSVNTFAIDPPGKALYAGTNGGGVFEFQIGSESADLSITQSDSPDPVQTGDNLTYSITVTNNGPSVATGVKVTDTIPNGETVVSATASQGNCTGQSTVVCELGMLASGKTVTVTLVVKLPFSGSTGGMSNTVTVSGVEPDPRTDNNTATVVTTVVAAPGPDLTGYWNSLKQKCKGTAELRRCTIKGSLVVQNQGTRDAASTTVVLWLANARPGNQLGQLHCPAVKGGKKKKLKARIVLFPGVTLQGQSISASVDPSNTIAELNEQNNEVRSAPIQ